MSSKIELDPKLKIYLEYCLAAKRVLTRNETRHVIQTHPDYKKLFKGIIQQIEREYGVWGNFVKAAMEWYPAEFEQLTTKADEVCSRLLQRYAKSVQRFKKTLSAEEIQINVGRMATVIKYFGSKDRFKEEAKKAYPECFKGIIDYDVWTQERHSDIEKILKNKKRFIITTAVGNASVNPHFLASLKGYCRATNSELLILVADNDLERIDQTLISENIIFDNTRVNNSLYISTIKISPKQFDPSTSLHRLAKGNTSVMGASPKQRLLYLPSASKDTLYPKCIIFTGAVTNPAYHNKKFAQKRTDTLADYDHVMGAVIVEIENSNIFHFRQVQMDVSGGFHDLDKYYLGSKVHKISPVALALGDWHSGQTDPVVKKASFEMAKMYKIKIALVNDLFDGISISHHNEGRHATKTKLAQKGMLSLEKELMGVVADLNEIGSHFEKVFIIKSNHDLFLNRYLEEARYVEDYQNHYLSLKLAIWLIEKKDPLKEFCSQFLKNPNKFIWLEEDEETYIEDIRVDQHGHVSYNGAKGSIKALEKVAPKFISAHAHTPQIFNGGMIVGTSTLLRLDYQHGGSSWFNTHGLIYPGGMRTLVNMIKGRWTLKD